MVKMTLPSYLTLLYALAQPQPPIRPLPSSCTAPAQNINSILSREMAHIQLGVWGIVQSSLKGTYLRYVNPRRGQLFYCIGLN